MSSPKSYKKLQAELDEIAEKMQSGDLDIEEALKLYKNGQKLVKEIEEYLKTAKNEVKKLTEP